MKKHLSLKQLAVTISDLLNKNGIDAVLSGGACVTIYTHNKYMSYDLDFVLLSPTAFEKINKVMKQIGFKPEGKYFKHDKSPYLVDFLSPPLSVGEEPVKKIEELKEGEKILRLLSPTDCVKDRLAAFYHWNDQQCLEQAVLVCENQKVNLKEVQRWSKKEGMSQKFEVFKSNLKASGS
ncbi:MAG: hypothetical protein GF421_04635 [Candidatus Aminicenantes bacterium]|nr:hypothetical protein [Candidatus Aminicenantes bacterium]